MNRDVSPIERLLRLEGRVDQLSQAVGPLGQLTADLDKTSRKRAIWPADEWLLTRLLRRSPIAISSYLAPAELTQTADGGLRLTSAPTSSPWLFCELTGGDALVWLTPDPPSWIWDSEVYTSLFGRHQQGTDGADLILQRLPVFKPVVRGRDWALVHPGEMVPRQRRSVAEEEQVELLRRLEQLERHTRQQSARTQAELSQLKATLRVQQDLLDRVLRLLGQPPEA